MGGSQFIEDVFHKIPALPDIIFTKQEFPISKEFQYHAHSPFSPIALLIIQGLAQDF